MTTNGFWAADIDARTVVGSSVEVTYKVNLVLETAGLKPGKTIVVQPAVSFSDGTYNDVDYGRFIIKEVIFNPCQCLDEYTLITVISGIHGTGNPTSSSSGAGLPVRLYFGEDSVSFDDQNIIDTSETGTNYHRLFEVYINDSKTTFSHERARMPYQTASGSLITSDFFHIDSVSTKFRGYKDSGITLNKYIRFYVLNYNATTGEYDGYLGQRNSADFTISKTGPIIRARKNVTARFYDDTNVDYIDLTFIDESNSSPGVIITSLPAYVDIELFDSLQLDGELLLLATCEVNWSPDSGKNIVDKVVDRKQHGSISELEFTESAQNYITAGERYLHGNGIINGFDIELSGRISGGLALVNGKFVITNSVAINIPLCTNLTAPPQTLNWIVCVNEDGNIINLPLTTSKSKFFARDGYSGLIYYIESVSFAELANRKDLTPLYIYNVTVTTTPSIVINSVSDARKFSKNETNSIPLTWSGMSSFDNINDPNNILDVSGHFKTLEQVKTWINWTQASRNTIKLKGVININSTIDLSGITAPTVFDGDEGCIFNINCPRGIILGSNITLKNIDFSWSPGTLTYAANDNVNLDTTGTLNSDNSNACIYAAIKDGNFLSNTTIDNCTFTGGFLQTQRPPYIALIFSGVDVNIDNIKITNNQFADPGSLANQCAIAIVALGLGVSSFKDPLLSNCIIEHNMANGNQSILISMLAANLPGFSSFSCENVVVRRNDVGSIGYLMTDEFNVLGLGGGFDLYKKQYGVEGLLITENTAMFIGTLETTGHILDPATDNHNYMGSGNVSITNNFCSVIYCTFFGSYGGGGSFLEGESLLISQNKLRSVLTQDIDSVPAINVSAIYGLGVANFTDYTAIYVDGRWNYPFGDLTYDTRAIQILDNVISYFKVNTIQCTYDTAIYVDSCAAIINGNIIKSFNNNAIVYENNIGRTNFIKVDIKNNQLYNNITTAATYISASDNNTTKFVNVTITDNSFDTYLTNSLASQMIVTFGFTATGAGRCIVKNNTNQTDFITLRAQDIGKIVYPIVDDLDAIYQDPLAKLMGGDTTTDNITNLQYGRTNSFGSNTDPSLKFGQFSVGFSNGGKLSWVIPITFINKNVKFVSASIGYNIWGFVSGSGEIKNVSLELSEQNAPNDAVILTTSAAITTATGSGNLVINTPDIINPIDIEFGYYLTVNCSLDPGATANAIISFNNLVFTFRY